MLRLKFHYSKSLFVSSAILLITLIGSYLLLTNLTTTRWGELFPPHEIDKTLPVSPTYSYTQSLKSEYQGIKGILLDVENPSPDSQIQLLISHNSNQQSVNVALSDALASGELYVQLPEPLSVGQGHSFQFTVSYLSGPDTNLRFQINNRPLPEGELTRFNTAQQLTQQHNGNIAFRVQYHATIAEHIELSTIKFLVLAIGAIVAWVLFTQYQPSSTPFSSLPWRRPDYFILALLILLTMTVYFSQLYPHLSDLPTQHDFTKDTLYLDSALKALSTGQIPYWHHATCGGQPLLGNPETNLFNLGTFISYMTGPVVGIKLMIILEIGLMTAGTYILARSIGLSPIGAIVPALVLPLSGYVVNRLFMGHTNYIGGLAFLPWVIFAYLRSLRYRRWLLITAILLVVIMLRGDTHSLSYGLILLGIWSLWFSIRGRTIRPIIALYIVVALFVLIGTPKILPTISGAEHYHTDDLPNFYIPLISQQVFGDIFLDDSEERPPINLVDGEEESWENIGLHVGLLAVALAIMGIIVAPRPVALLLGGTIIIFLILGEGSVYDRFLQPLPVIGGLLRLPSRILIMAILSGSLAAGFFIDRLYKHHSFLGISVAMLLIFLLFDDMSSYTREIAGRTQFIPPSATTTLPYPQTQTYDQQDPEQHTITHINSGATVPGLCLDFNQSPPFDTDVVDALVTDASGNPIGSILAPNTLTIPSPPPAQKIFLRLVDSSLLTIEGGYTLLPNDENILPVVVTDSDKPLVLSYKSPSFWPGLFLALGIVATILTTPRRKLLSLIRK